MSGLAAKCGWLKTEKDNKNYFEGDSDALIVKGLVKIITEVFLASTLKKLKLDT